MHEIILFFAALFAFNFWWALIIILAAWSTITALVETDHGGWATTTLIGSFLIYTVWAKYAIFAYAKTHIQSLVLYLLGYFVIGIIWSFFVKWPLFIKKHVNLFNAMEKKYLQDQGTTALPTDEKGLQNFMRWVTQYGTRENLEINPQVDRHAGDLTRWASFWPWSMFWFVFNNPIRRACESAIRLFHGLLQGMSDKMSAGVNAKLTPQVETAVTVNRKLENVKL